MKKLGLFCLLVGLVFAACRENTDEVTPNPVPYVPPIVEQWVQPLVAVNGSVTGFVVNEAGEPVENATVKLGNLNTTTDVFGHFFFRNTSLNAKGTLVSVEKDGFFHGSRRFFANEGADNRVKIELLTKTFSDSFAAQDGATVNVSGGASVTFKANSIRNADGSAYTGTVRVATKWLDPTDYRTFEQMPGNLQGVNVLAEEVALSTVGMLAVELESDSGEPLNILEGQTAQISMPIPDAFLASAPNEVPNWSYYEDLGMWVEEGVSVKEGNAYVGEVSHFSYWNHDFKDPLIEFTGVFQDQNGNPLENYKIVISQPNSLLSGCGYTDSNGKVTGLIPMDYDLELEVIGLCDDDVLWSQPIGPFPTDTDLGVITVSVNNINSTNLTGTLTDCDGNPASNSVLQISFDEQVIYKYPNGSSFDITFFTCQNTTEIEVVGINLEDLFQSTTLAVDAGVASDLGAISLCDIQVENYIQVNVGGEEALYFPANFTTNGNSNFISYVSQDSLQGEVNVYFGFDGDTPGDYTNNSFIEVIYDFERGWNIFGNDWDSFIITEYGDIGEPVKGNFSGTLTNSSATQTVMVDVIGSFSIKRE